MEALDAFFHVLHWLVILANTTFWMFRRTLRTAQIVQALTLLSWFVLGIFYGFGYCFLTDWQWRVKEALGETDLPNSYIKYALDRLTGHDWPSSLVDAITAVVMLVSVLGCILRTLAVRRQRLHSS